MKRWVVLVTVVLGLVAAGETRAQISISFVNDSGMGSMSYYDGSPSVYLNKGVGRISVANQDLWGYYPPDFDVYVYAPYQGGVPAWRKLSSAGRPAEGPWGATSDKVEFPQMGTYCVGVAFYYRDYPDCIRYSSYPCPPEVSGENTELYALDETGYEASEADNYGFNQVHILTAPETFSMGGIPAPAMAPSQSMFGVSWKGSICGRGYPVGGSLNNNMECNVWGTTGGLLPFSGAGAGYGYYVMPFFPSQGQFSWDATTNSGLAAGTTAVVLIDDVKAYTGGDFDSFVYGCPVPPSPTPTPTPVEIRVFGTVTNPVDGSCCPADLRLDKDPGSGYQIGVDTDTTTYNKCYWSMSTTDQSIYRVRAVGSGAIFVPTVEVPPWSSSWPSGSLIGTTRPNLVEWFSPPLEAGPIGFKVNCPTATPTPVTPNTDCVNAGFYPLGYGVGTTSGGTKTNLPMSYQYYVPFKASFTGVVNGVLVKAGNWGGAGRSVVCEVRDAEGSGTVSIESDSDTFGFDDQGAWRPVDYRSSEFSLTRNVNYRLYCKSWDPWGIDNMVFWNYYSGARTPADVNGRNYILCFKDTSNLAAKICRVTVASATVTEGVGQTISVWGTGNTNPGTENVRLWLERLDGTAISPLPVGTVETWIDGSRYYYRVGSCNSTDAVECSAQAVVNNLAAGNYKVHCDLPISSPPTRCSGNPFCSINGGADSCTGWNSCGNYDNAEFVVSSVPQTSSFVIKNSAGLVVNPE